MTRNNMTYSKNREVSDLEDMRVSFNGKRQVLVIYPSNFMVACSKIPWFNTAIPGCEVADSLPHIFPSLWWLTVGMWKEAWKGGNLSVFCPLLCPFQSFPSSHSIPLASFFPRPLDLQYSVSTNSSLTKRNTLRTERVRHYLGKQPVKSVSASLLSIMSSRLASHNLHHICKEEATE